MYTKEKQQLIDFGNRLIDEKYTLGTGGNLSLYIRKTETVLITPSGIPFNKIQLEDIVSMTCSGEILDGIKKPSSEW